ncbi:MAG: hypothetical protein ACOYX1_16545 [Acidobacteriota bacterium]
MSIQPDEKCVCECVKSGRQKSAPIDARGKMMVLSSQQAPEKYAPKRVKIRGVFLREDGNSPDGLNRGGGVKERKNDTAAARTSRGRGG